VVEECAASDSTAITRANTGFGPTTTRVAADLEQVKQLSQQQTGVTTPVSSSQTQAQYIAPGAHVENRVPPGATWDGNKELLVTAEELKPMRDGVILPKKE